jgi:hypothetical protein
MVANARLAHRLASYKTIAWRLRRIVELSYPFGPKIALTLACHDVGVVVVAMVMMMKTTTMLLLVYACTAVLAQLNYREILRHGEKNHHRREPVVGVR